MVTRWALLATVYYGYDDTAELAIYTTDGRLYRYYGYGDDGYKTAVFDVWNLWAKDGSYRLLYFEDDIYAGGRPCILDLQANTTDCLVEVETWRNNGIGSPGNFRWLPNSSGVSFSYSNRAIPAVGLCIMTLQDRAITCPIDETVLFSANDEATALTYLNYYEWSPDGRYIRLDLNVTPPDPYVRGSAYIATVARNGSQFRL